MDNRDSIDFEKMSVSKLYLKILIPTLLGMISSIILTITDGYFVGNYAGSDALAAVNIAVPLFMITTAFGLMFGAGASVVAAIHMSQNNIKAARINITQSFIVSLIIMLIICITIMLMPEKIAILFGSNLRLMPQVIIYITYLTPSLCLFLIETIGLFLIRLDGSPKYAMMCGLVPAIINIIGDFVLVGILGMGIKGAVLATSACFFTGGIMVIIYFIFLPRTLKLYALKLSKTSFWLTLRNTYNICKLGFPGFLGEIAIALMTLLGNYYFLKYLAEDGVAAYSITCYYFPIVFMIYNAITQSAQPIISYNYGRGDMQKVNKAFNISLKTIIIAAICITLFMIFFIEEMVGLFLAPKTNTYNIAVHGIPYFALGFIFFAFNMLYVGFYQSIELVGRSNIITLLRGYILLILSFAISPLLFGIEGIWLAIPIAEAVTSIILFAVYIAPKLIRKFKSKIA